MTINIFSNDDFYTPTKQFIGVKDTFFQRLKKKLRDRKSRKQYLKVLR